MNRFARFAASALALSLVPAMLMGCGKKETAASSDLDYIKQKGTLVVGITDFAPMDYQDADGSWIGFDADLAKAFAESLGVEVQFQTIEWDNKVMELDGKTILSAVEKVSLSDELLEKMRREHEIEEAEHEHEHHHHHDHNEHDERDYEHEHHHDHEGCCHDHEHHHDHEGCCHGQEHHHHHADEVFTSWGVETPKKFTQAGIQKALEELENGELGTVLRAKGIVPAEDGTWIHFDYVPGEADVRTGSPAVTGRLCVIGAQLDEKAIAALFGV